MCQTGLDKILANCEILIKVYKVLPFVDQLRLSRVNRSLRNIFETYLWKDTYQTLLIHKNALHFVVTNETGINRLCLSAEEFQEFLLVYADNVQELIQNRIAPILDLNQFPNLHSISYKDVTIPKGHLDLIAEFYPNLKNIYLCCFYENEKGDYVKFLQIGENCKVNTLLKMKNLKSLTIQNDGYLGMKYQDFWQIVNGLKIEKLKLKVNLEPNAEAEEQLNHHESHLRELEIETSFDSQKWAGNFSAYLNIFENLISLSMKIADIVTHEIIEIIATKCPKLLSLHIAYTVFKDIRTFPLAPKVTELSLLHCRGLTMSNIKQLLVDTELEKFSCRNCDLEGVFEDFKISPTIKSLDLDGISTNQFKSAFENNTNLQKITWYHTLYNDEREIVRGIPLNTCTHLVTLNMREGFMALEILLQMKSLRKLILPHPAPFLDWTYILALLKHSQLTELTIMEPTIENFAPIPADVAAEAFPTTLLQLQIPLDIFEIALEFWLDLCQFNPNMQLLCQPFQPDKLEFLKKLVNNQNFPRSIRTIDVCCFNVDCCDLRNKFDFTVAKLNYATTNHLYYEYTDDVFRIILKRT